MRSPYERDGVEAVFLRARLPENLRNFIRKARGAAYGKGYF